MTTLTIRDARPDELGAVSALLVEAYAEYMPPPPRHEAWDEYERDVADVWGRLHDSELIVAEDAGALLGAVTFYPRGSHHQGWPDGWPSIRLLAVAPAARGRGVGRALTEECIRRARTLGAPVIALHTTNLMLVAKAMYERMGFERAEEYDFRPAPDVHVMGFTRAL